jgi:dipeptidyl aminopeptidase/acylaminoacyl peptidase
MVRQYRWFSCILLPPARLRQALLLSLALCCLATLLAACSIQPGGDLLAFVRDGKLFVIAPDGSDPREIATGDIVGGAWSPDHHQLVFRAGKAAFTSAARLASGSTRGNPDAVSDLYITSVSGGAPLRISPDATVFARSDAWWNPNGNRLLYREEFNAPQTAPIYFASQSDQPVGIARKAVADIVSIPVLSADGSQVAGIDATGNLRVGTPGQTGKIVAKSVLLALPGTNRPARVLWQPHAQALLYPTAGQEGGITLILRNLNGNARAIGTVPMLLDLAFAPDGEHVLIRTPQDFQLWPTSGASQAAATWHVAEADPMALPWWSPDGSKLLVQDNDGWRLVDAATGKIISLLASTPRTPFQITSTTRWYPAPGSPWSPDGARMVFASTASAKWQGHAIAAPKGAVGIYVAQVDGAASTEKPSLLASGNVRAPTWSYLDPSTVFLVTS